MRRPAEIAALNSSTVARGRLPTSRRPGPDRQTRQKKSPRATRSRTLQAPSCAHAVAVEARRMPSRFAMRVFSGFARCAVTPLARTSVPRPRVATCTGSSMPSTGPVRSMTSGSGPPYRATALSWLRNWSSRRRGTYLLARIRLAAACLSNGSSALRSAATVVERTPRKGVSRSERRRRPLLAPARSASCTLKRLPSSAGRGRGFPMAQPSHHTWMFAEVIHRWGGVVPVAVGVAAVAVCLAPGAVGVAPPPIERHELHPEHRVRAR